MEFLRHNRVIIYLLLIILFDCYAGNSLLPPDIVVRPADIKDLAEPSGGGGSGGHAQIIPQEESAPLNVTRQIFSPLRKDGFFVGEDIIEVLVKITALKKGIIDNIEIWEIVGDGLQIINCTYPLRTSSIKELLDYESSDKSMIKLSDILNPISIRDVLINSSTENIGAKDGYSRLYLYRQLSNDTNNALYLNLSDQLNYSIFSNSLVNDLNKFINDEKFGENDNNIKKIKHMLARKNSVYLNGLIEEVEYNRSTEYKIINRKLIEYTFKGMIKKISINKEHEDYKVENGSNSINIKRKDVFQGESIIFKYYLYPNKVGQTRIRSIIKTKDYNQEALTEINIIKREPNFEIWYTCPSKEITLNEPVEFHYYIKYLGGDEDEKNFTIRVNPVKNAPTGEIYCVIESPAIINRTFVRGNTQDFRANATYKVARKELSPPSILIGGKLDRFAPDISVFSKADMVNKMSFESFSLKFSRYLLIITVFSAIVALCNILFLWRESSQKRDNRDKHMRILEKLTEILERINK